MTPAATVAGPRLSSTDVEVLDSLRAELQSLRHRIRHVLPALWAVHDDPCKPAQRELLGDVLNELTNAVTENGTNP
jgi:hypothetical protein